jgi:hypothetical protein
MPAPTQSYPISFDEPEMNLVLQGLGKLPAERSFMLLQRLGSEIAEINRRAQEPPMPPAPVNTGGSDNAAALGIGGGEVHNSLN